MNKKEFANLLHTVSKEVAPNYTLTKPDCKMIIDVFVEGMMRAMSNGEKVDLLGFGTFSVKDSKEKVCYHPITREEYRLPERKRVSFHMGDTLRKAVNGENK